MSIIVLSSHTRIGAWVNSKNVGEKSTSILYNTISLTVMQGYRTNTKNTGSLFLYTMCGLEKLGLVDQTGWSVFFRFLLRTLVVGRRQHSESIEVPLDME